LPLLDGFIRVLRLAVERCTGTAEEVVIRRQDLSSGAGIADSHLTVLSEILQWEAPFLRGFQGGAADEWVSPVDDSIVNYWHATSPDDYLRIRANELRSNSRLGWGYVAPGTPRATDLTDDLDDAPFSEIVQADEPAATNLGEAHGERHWEIGDRIGHGGFGQVFAARSGYDEAVIKLVPKDPGASREFLFVDLIDVPNVVPVWDSGECNGFWFIVMPRADQSLKDRLDAGDFLQMPEIIAILIDIADALVALDGRGIVHRDLKPANVLRLDGRWCLADFGISRYAEATTAPDTHKWAFSPPYTAPERWRSERATSTTDVYSLGVIAFELATGRTPFEAGSIEEYREAHLHADPPAMDEVPTALAALIAECLYKAPAARPGAQNLRARLERAAAPARSAGLARLQETNRWEVARRSEAARADAAARTEAERRQALAGAAQRTLAAVSDALLQALIAEAPTAVVRRDPDVGNWTLALGQARLTMGRVRMPDPWQYPSPPFDLVLVSELSSRCPLMLQGTRAVATRSGLQMRRFPISFSGSKPASLSLR
jgi:hypothetical protein